MSTIVVKFGGSSLASAGQFRKVADIIHADPERHYVVASAPGKRDSSDTKVTDLLYRCYDAAVAGDDYHEVLSLIEKRFASIMEELSISFDLGSEIAVIDAHLAAKPERDYMASRGEYLNSKLLAAYLGFTFIDPADYVVFENDGTFDAETTNENLAKALDGVSYAVVAGFYGALKNGTVHTFSRGGSDVTGSIVARAVNADLYENWTDVSGMLAADPRIVKDPAPITTITYTELRELSYMGASVLHEDAVFPVRKANIPINIRNTNAPEDPGTMIVPKVLTKERPPIVTGIAGKKGFSAIQIEVSMMNNQIGFTAKLLNIIAKHNVSIEHIPSGIDHLSVILATSALEPVREALLKDIEEAFHPEQLMCEDGIALLAVVGRGMAATKGIAAKVLQSVTDADINIKMIDQGASELDIILGVEEAYYEKAICSIYNAVFNS